ncbi:TonB family protein [Fibrobacter sp.]|uniref:TonB family protein n=1 Tax=Fibrobacter sp. TaxID=35828 RepID=UPI0025C41BF6|nr:TonB family protein [Fibrobacter sp.]MBR3071652.1 TonB family protein [Fibrobacter sp.]
MKFMKWIGFFIVAAMFVACAPKTRHVSTEKFDEAISSTKHPSSAFLDSIKELVLPIYDMYVLERPGLTGKISVTMTVRQDGGVDSVSIDTSTVNYPELEKEVQEKLGQLKCPLIDYRSLKPKANIEFSAEGVAVTQTQPRSASQIMKVVRKEAPRLRSIYNSYSKKRSFDGKVRVKWSIPPSGDVENAEIVEATTEYPEFEKAILEDIKQWKFQDGYSGKTTVTVPFTFSE